MEDRATRIERAIAADDAACSIVPPDELGMLRAAAFQAVNYLTYLAANLPDWMAEERQRASEARDGLDRAARGEKPPTSESGA